MRGKPPTLQSTTQSVGITPAHAGKTNHSDRCNACVVDHPRACGENRRRFSKRAKRSGSPPRMRGKPLSRSSRTAGKGITPAHAGKTLRTTATEKQARDHPRACGENHKRKKRGISKMGSPPRMRGKPQKEEKRHIKDGITPAHAGKTRQSRAARRSGRDHPRACGENLRVSR